MLKLFKKKNDVAIQEDDSKVNFTAEEALKNTLKKLYHPTYEQIKKDILNAIKNKAVRIRYDAAYIDSDTADKLSDEGFYIIQSDYLNVPYVSIRWRQSF